MATAKSLSSKTAWLALLSAALILPTLLLEIPAEASVATGADVVCDISNAANVSSTTCTNTGSSGTNITLYGAPSRSTRGQGSLGFNLTSLSQNQYGIGSMGSTTGVETITVEMVLNLAANGSIYSSNGSMLFQFATNSAAYNIYHFQNKLGFNTFNNEVYGIDATLLEGGWHHYVFIASKSATDSSQQIYIDGVKKSLSFVFGSASTAGNKVFNSSGNFTLMNHGFSSNAWNAKGELSLLRVYKRGLSEQEITSNFQAEQSRLNTASSISSITLSSAAKKGTITSITATVSNPGRVRFFYSGKRISNCLSVSTTGTNPITAVCNWKPSLSGKFALTATLTPTDTGISSSKSQILMASVGRRSNNR